MADFKCGSTGELIRELEAERDRLRKERDEWRELYESVDSKRDALSACVAELKQQLDAAREDQQKACEWGRMTAKERDDWKKAAEENQAAMFKEHDDAVKYCKETQQQAHAIHKLKQQLDEAREELQDEQSEVKRLRGAVETLTRAGVRADEAAKKAEAEVTRLRGGLERMEEDEREDAECYRNVLLEITMNDAWDANFIRQFAEETIEDMSTQLEVGLTPPPSPDEIVNNARLEDAKKDAKWWEAKAHDLQKQLDEARDAFMLGIVERCQKLGIQECHSCPRSDCCDNTNPVVQENKRLREGLEEAAATMAGMLRVHPDLAEISNVDNTVIFIRQLITPPPSPDSAVLCPDGSRVTLEHVETCPECNGKDKYKIDTTYGPRCPTCEHVDESKRWKPGDGDDFGPPEVGEKCTMCGGLGYLDDDTMWDGEYVNRCPVCKGTGKFDPEARVHKDIGKTRRANVAPRNTTGKKVGEDCPDCEGGLVHLTKSASDWCPTCKGTGKTPKKG